MKKFSIIIPARNEGEGIKQIIQSVKKYSDDIIVVDGHSKDQTRSIARKLGVRFFLDHGIGKGDAMLVGMRKAKYETLIYFDADGSHDEKDMPRMASLLLSGNADLVIGSRRTGGSFDIQMSLQGMVRSLGCDILVTLINHRFGTSLTDVLYSFRGIRKSVFMSLNIQDTGFGIEQEMVVSCLKKGLVVREIPSREKARAWGESKLHTITGIKFLVSLVKSLYFT